jgi:protein SCO1
MTMRLIAAAALLCCLPLSATPGVAQQQWHSEYFPNVELVTQDGKKVRFYDDVIKGKVVAINFIYTNCSDVCPLDTAALRRVQTLIGKGMGRDVFFYSISLDPKHDTPAVLKKYRQSFAIGPGWTFLTGRPQDIALIQHKLGINPANPGELSSHDTRFVMGNEAIARWVKRTPMDNPYVLANILTRDLPTSGMPNANRPEKSYADAKPIVGFSSGESLFMSRCSACHNIGSRETGLGPDLAGVVERRPRSWLMRWIKEPDRMRAQNDPTAKALVAKYRNNARMPNLRLSDANAADLIEFIASETRRQQQAATSGKAHEGHHHSH